MFLRPLAAIAVLVLADWGLWTWSIGADHGGVSLFAGLVMAPLFVALVWLATMTATALGRAITERVRAPPRPTTALSTRRPPEPAPEQEQRLAA